MYDEGDKVYGSGGGGHTISDIDIGGPFDGETSYVRLDKSNGSRCSPVEEEEEEDEEEEEEFEDCGCSPDEPNESVFDLVSAVEGLLLSEFSAGMNTSLLSLASLSFISIWQPPLSSSMLDK